MVLLVHLILTPTLFLGLRIYHNIWPNDIILEKVPPDIPVCFIEAIGIRVPFSHHAIVAFLALRPFVGGGSKNPNKDSTTVHEYLE